MAPPKLSSSNSTSGNLDLALLIFRFAGAIVFLYHGSAILFGVFGGPGFWAFAGFTHAPVIVGFLVGPRNSRADSHCSPAPSSVSALCAS